MDSRWLFLVLGPLLATVVTRDLLAAWKNQCFKKGRGQLFDVPRSEMPITFWFLMFGLTVLVSVSLWLSVTTAIEIFGQTTQ